MTNLRCITHKKTKREIDTLVKTYNTYKLDTTEVICADSDFTSYCRRVEFYADQRDELVKVIVRYDSVTAHKDASFYFERGFLIKVEATPSENRSHTAIYYKQDLPLKKRHRRNDAFRSWKNEAQFYYEMFSKQ